MILVILVAVFVGIVYIAKADMYDPGWLTKECQPGETEVSCSFSYSKPFSDRVGDAVCKKYETDPNYYELVSHASTWGGGIRFCKKVTSAQPNLINPNPSNLELVKPQPTSSDEQQTTQPIPQPTPPDYTWPIGVGVGVISVVALALLMRIKKQSVPK